MRLEGPAGNLCIMFKKKRTSRLRELEVDARVIARLTRLFLAELGMSTFESVRRRRTLGIGAVAVGLTTVGLLARHAVHGPDAPTPAA